CGTILKDPNERLLMGRTELTEDTIMTKLLELATSSYRPITYHLFDHNCNTFSNEFCQLLCGRSIPSHITSLPQEVSKTPFGQSLRPIIERICDGIHAVNGRHGHSFAKPIHDNVDYYVHPHRFEDLKQFFLPISFDVSSLVFSKWLLKEPLPEELSPNRISFWWIVHCSRHNLSHLEHLEKRLVELSEISTSTAETEFTLFDYTLLDFRENFTTYEACWGVCELFRACVFKHPYLLQRLILEDPGNNLMLLPMGKPTLKSNHKVTEKEDIVLFQIAKCNLLCNLLSVALKDSMEILDSFPVPQMVELAIELLENYGTSVPNTTATLDELLEQPTHNQEKSSCLRLTVFSMCQNLVLFQQFTENEALNLGVFLIHFACDRTSHDTIKNCMFFFTPNSLSLSQPAIKGALRLVHSILRHCRLRPRI
ncbi:Desumoylating isopeptidase 1, partial [Cichlidogyrus casuarinus]